MCSLIVDSRERSIIPLLTMKHIVKQIDVGDYSIMDPEGQLLIIIERKTLDDYAASLKDGRINNINKMVEVQNKTNCRLYMIIEGELRPPLSSRYQNIPFKNIQSNIFHLMMRHGIQCIYTKCISDTANLLSELIQSMDTYCIHSKQKTGGNINSLHKKLTQQEIVEKMFMAIPGITRKNVKSYMTYSLKEYINGEVDLSTIKISKPVLNALNNLPDVKILSAIPSITSDTAKKILEIHSLANLSKKSIDEIRYIQISAKSKVGPAKAKKIIENLNYKLIK